MIMAFRAPVGTAVKPITHSCPAEVTLLAEKFKFGEAFAIINVADRNPLKDLQMFDHM